MLRLNLLLQSRHLHKALRCFCKDRRCPAGTISETGCISPAWECQVQRKLLCSLLITSILLQLSAAALLKQRSWLPREQLLMVSPCTGSCSLKPSLLELFQPLTLWRKTCVTTWVVIGNSLSTVLDASSSDPREGWFLSPLLVEVRRQVDGRCWWEPPNCPFKAEQQREDSGKPGDLIAYVCANCGVLGMLAFLMLWRSRKLVLWLWCPLGITVIFMASEKGI